MTHLGSRLSALADGQLGTDEVDRAMAHVAACPRCADELAAARGARDVLAATAWAVPQPDPALTARLLAMRAAPPARPGDPFAGVGPGVAGCGRAGAVRLGGVVPSREGVTGRAQVWVVGSLTGLALVVVVLFLLGSSVDVVPDDRPGTALAMLGDAASARSTAATLDLDGLRAHGWTVVAALPPGWTLTSAQEQGGVLQLGLAGPGDVVVVVTEQRGHLNRDLLVAAPRESVGDRDVTVLSCSPWTVVWQAGDTVVGLVAPAADPQTRALVAAFPASAYDDGVPARIGRGWADVVAALP